MSRGGGGAVTLLPPPPPPSPTPLLGAKARLAYWGLQNLCTKKAKSKKCKAFLIWHIKWLIIILWALHQWPVNRAWFELFALLGAKILQTPVPCIPLN